MNPLTASKSTAPALFYLDETVVASESTTPALFYHDETFIASERSVRAKQSQDLRGDCFAEERLAMTLNWTFRTPCSGFSVYWTLLIAGVIINALFAEDSAAWITQG
ncbi:MAG: hypothetical protein ABSF99_04530 [Anaerolineales bacterium]